MGAFRRRELLVGMRQLEQERAGGDVNRIVDRGAGTLGHRTRVGAEERANAL